MAAPLIAALGRMFASVAARAVGTRVMGAAATRAAAARAAARGATGEAVKGAAAQAGQKTVRQSLFKRVVSWGQDWLFSRLNRGGDSGGNQGQSGSAGRSGSPSRPGQPGTSPRQPGQRPPGDWRGIVDSVRNVGKGLNPDAIGGKIGDSLKQSLQGLVNGVQQNRESGNSMSLMQRMMSGLVERREQPVPLASQMPGLTADQKLSMMGRPQGEIDQANRQEQERQHRELSEQKIREETEKLTEKFKDFTKGVIRGTAAFLAIPMVVRRLNEAIISTRREDAYHSGRVAGAFARYDIANFQLQQQGARNTSSSTSAAIDSQIELNRQIAPLLEDLKTLTNAGLVVANKIAGIMLTIATPITESIGVIADGVEEIAGNTREKGKGSELDVFNTMKGLASEKGFDAPGRVNPLSPVI